MSGLDHDSVMAGTSVRLHGKRTRSRRFSIGVMALLGLSVFAKEGRADEGVRPIAEAIELGDARCFAKESLAASVASWLGHGEIDERLTIVVADVPDGVRFEVRRESVSIGERTLEVVGLPCEDVRSAVGLGIASAIDVTVLESLGVTSHDGGEPAAPPSPPLPASPGLPSGPPATSPATPPAPSPAQPSTLRREARAVEAWLPPDERKAPREPARFHIGVEVGLLVNLLPKVAPGFSPSVEVTVVRWLDFRASVLATTSITTTLNDPSGGFVGQADTGMLGGRFDACGVGVVTGQTRLRGCAGILAGAIRASGKNLLHPQSSVGAWVGPIARADIRWLGTDLFGFVLAFDGFAAAYRPELRIVDRSHKIVGTNALPSVGFGVSLGPSLAF